MLDVLVMVATLGICGGIGLPITELLPLRFAGRALVAPSLGLAVLGVAAPVTYRWAVSPSALLVASAVLAIAGTAWWARQVARRGVAAGERAVAVATAAAWLATLLLMMLPRWVGGEQFSVFQGNIWDCFGYLESALTYARRSYDSVSTAGDAELLRNPLMPVAQMMIGARPSVHLLYATVSRLAPSEAYRLYYPFLVALLAQNMLVAVFLVRVVLPTTRPAIWFAIAAVFPLGFWGQYLFDINAWSQIAASPMLFLLAGLVLHTTIVPAARGDELRVAAVLAILVAGSVYVYPEGFAVYFVALGAFALTVPVARMIRRRSFEPRQLIPLAGIAGLATVVLFPPQVDFLITQVAWGSARKVPWWQFFQAFFYGRDAVPGQPTDFAAALMGLYFATPTAKAAALTAALLRTAIVAVIAGVLGALAMVRERELHQPGRSLVLGWVAIALLLLLPGGVLAYQGTYWAAGKVVSYAAPVFATLLAMPIAFRFTHPALRALRWAAVVFVAFQLGLGVVRVAAARAHTGIHYAAPYPSVPQPGFKKDFGWDVRGLDAVLNARQAVLIKPMDLWPEAYLMMYLYAHHIRFAKAGPVNTYFGGGRDLGTMYMPTPDVEISVERNAFVLHFHDGSPDVRVGSRKQALR